MTRLHLILATLALITIAGLGWYFTQSSSNEAQPQQSEQSADQSESANQDSQVADTTEQSGTIADLLSRTGSWRCDVSSNVAAAPSTGVAYIADGKIRGDFTSKVAAMGNLQVKTHLIVIDGFAHVWTDLYPQGAKTAIDAPASETQSGFSHDTQVSYLCVPHQPDASLFVLPANISFSSY